MSALAKVADALTAFERADERLAAALEKAYPIGAVVSATLGRARVRGRVWAHGGCGYYRGYLFIENEATGKKRRFYAARRSLHDVAVESLPESEENSRK